LDSAGRAAIAASPDYVALGDGLAAAAPAWPPSTGRALARAAGALGHSPSRRLVEALFVGAAAHPEHGWVAALAGNARVGSAARRRALLVAAAPALGRGVPGLNTRELCDMAMACATVLGEAARAPPPPAVATLFGAVAAEAAARAAGLDTTAVARLGRALVESGELEAAAEAAREGGAAAGPAAALLAALCRRAPSLEHDVSNSILDVAWFLGRAVVAAGLATPAVAAPRAALEALAPALAAGAPLASASAVSAAAHGLASARVYAPAALDALAARAAELARTGSPRFAATTLWSVAKLNHRHTLAFEQVAAALTPLVAAGRVDAQSGATLALALTRAGAAASPAAAALLDALGVAAIATLAAGGRPGDGRTRAAVNLCFALAVAKRLPRALFSLAAAAAAEESTMLAVELGQLHVASLALRAEAQAGPATVRPAVDGLFLGSLLAAGRTGAAAKAAMRAGAPLGPSVVTRSHVQLLDALAALHGPVAAEFVAGDFGVVDAALPGDRVAIEFDGPLHFFVNDPTRAVGATVFKRRLLRAVGWRVVSVPHFHWAQLGNSRAAQEAYVALALAGGRGAVADAALAAALAELGPPAVAAAVVAGMERMLAEYGATDDGDGAGDGRRTQLARLLGKDAPEEWAVSQEPEPAAQQPTPAAQEPGTAVQETAPAVLARAALPFATRLAAVRGRQGRLTPGAALAAGRRAAKEREREEGGG
jgi:hypothetical protein